MSLLRIAVLGSPEVFHEEKRLTFSLRKALALLVYLAVEGGMHPRSKLAAFLWPDSDPHDARTALRNAIALLRGLLSDANSSDSQYTHLLIEHDLLGIDLQSQIELDLDMVQQAWKQAQAISIFSSEEQQSSLITQWQEAVSLVRGPFLDGFYLHETSAFDEWLQMQQNQWEVRLHLLFDRLSSCQEAAGELEQAKATLVRWLALDPLREDIYQRLMRLYLALGERTAALQLYSTCKERLVEELHIQPSPETIALARSIRATTSTRSISSPPRPSTSPSPTEVAAPFIGRTTAFSQLISYYQQARQKQPQAVFVTGDAGIGKTRLATEFVAWAKAQGADVLTGHAFEMSGRLPYQPLVEAMRQRFEGENAPEDLLDDIWLAELSRILPELRVRYPDLPVPTEDDLTAKVRLFEAVARLLDALAQRTPLVLVLDDVQWVDVASLDMVRYLARHWKGHDTPVLLLGTVRGGALATQPTLVGPIADLERDLPVAQIVLQPLSQAETFQLVQAIVGEEEHNIDRRNGTDDQCISQDSDPLPSPSHPHITLGNWLFMRTGGLPFYMLETLKMFLARGMLEPRLTADGTWRLEIAEKMTAAFEQEEAWRDLLPPLVRNMLLARLASLSPAAYQLVKVSAVLGNPASSKLLWRMADLKVREGWAALEEAVRSGILREEKTSQVDSYRISHDLMRDVVYTEIGEAQRCFLHQCAFEILQEERASATQLAYHALAARQAEAAYPYSVEAGDEAMAVFAVHDAITHYEQARSFLQGDMDQQQMPIAFSAMEVEHLYIHLARAYALQDAWEKAKNAYEELLAYARQQHLPALVCMTLNRLAILVAQQSFDMPTAQIFLEEAWSIATASNDQKALAETEWNLAQIAVSLSGPKDALQHAQHALELAQATNDQELKARCLLVLGWIHIYCGDFQETIQCMEASLALYAALDNKDIPRGRLSAQYILAGTPPTQQMTNHAAEASCKGIMAVAQVNCGQLTNAICNARMALAQSKEIQNVWAQANSMLNLNHGLLDAGEYEEALQVAQEAVALMHTLPPNIHFQRILIALGNTYQALLQLEEARATFEEALAVIEKFQLGPLFRVLALTPLCRNYALKGDWERAHSYAIEVLAARERVDAPVILMDFHRHYEIEALLRGGDEKSAREEIQQFDERLKSNRRFCLSYRLSLAALARWSEKSEQAIAHFHEAARLAEDIGLPGELWQIQASLAAVYETCGQQEQAQIAADKAATIIQQLAERIEDKALRARFLAAPQIQQMLQKLTP